MDALACGGGRNQAALTGGLDALVEDAVGLGGNLDIRFGGNEKVHVLHFFHTLKLADSTLKYKPRRLSIIGAALSGSVLPVPRPFQGLDFVPDMRPLEEGCDDI